MNSTIRGEALANIPWEEKPPGSPEVVWRYTGNPIIGWNPIPKAARIFNSAVLPYNGGFVGAFRADQRNGRATLFFRPEQERAAVGDRPGPDRLGRRRRGTMSDKLRV
jgi:hypothetical protein